MGLQRRIWRWGVGAVLGLGAAALAVSCVGPPWYYVEKYQPAAEARPLAKPGALVPERQTEPHTCGLCSLSAVYRAYGLDPEALRVRVRSGVDKPVVNFMPGTRGTIHPDMLRVLRQDGFRASVVNGQRDAERIREHLERGHVAIALIRVNELHWVVLGGVRDGRVVICDSLRDELYDEPLAAYLEQRVYSMVLVEPAR